MKGIIILVLIGFAAAQLQDAIHSVDSPYFDEFWKNYQSPVNANKFNRTGRITGGSEAQRYQFPFQAGLLLKRPDGMVYLCGGSLISKNYILTAAHCLDGIESVQVNLGSHNLHSNDAMWRATFPRANMKIHEQYNSANIWNDIGLIRVTGVVLTPGKVELVKLLPRNLQNEHFIGSTVRVSGWGIHYDGGNTSPVLRFVDLTVRERKVCSDVFGTVVVRESNVCTTGDANKSSCGGDSGGPLTVTSGSNKYQIGVVSYGAALGCELRFPSVFTRVGSFVDWIEKNSDVKL